MDCGGEGFRGISPQSPFILVQAFCGIHKDLAKLAGILGPSSINTIRIYIMATGAEHHRRIEGLGLVVQMNKNHIIIILRKTEKIGSVVQQIRETY